MVKTPLFVIVLLIYVFVGEVHCGWQLTWSDEFNGQKKLNTSNWNPFYSFEASLNTEMEYYTMDAFSFTDDTIGLVQSKEFVHSDIGSFNYTSALITSKFKFAQTYGYFEMRAQVPGGLGMWPAFWLLPQEALDNQAAEIDIMEMIMNEPTTVHTTFHCNYSSGGGDGFEYVNESFSANDYHIFSAQWIPGLILFYVDGVNVFNHSGVCVPNRPEYILANVAIGGWATPPNSSTPFPSAMNIDYIRAYEYVGEGGISLEGPGEGIAYIPRNDPQALLDLGNPYSDPETVNRGDSVTVYATLLAPVYTPDLNLQYTVKNITGGTVASETQSNLILYPNVPKTISFTFTIPASQQDGYIKIGLGIFDVNWKEVWWMSNVWAVGINKIVGANTSN